MIAAAFTVSICWHILAEVPNCWRITTGASKSPKSAQGIRPADGFHAGEHRLQFGIDLPYSIARGFFFRHDSLLARSSKYWHPGCRVRMPAVRPIGYRQNLFDHYKGNKVHGELPGRSD